MRLGRNIRALRENKGLSIENLADELELSVSGLYSYESGRTEPDAKKVIKICKFFNIPTDAFLLGDFRKTSPAEITRLGRERVLFPISVDKEGRENVQLVSIKAKAGYTAGYNDPEYISGLPSFQLPFLAKERTYRAFQIEGDSMNPIPHGSYVVGEYVESLKEIKDGHAYLIVTKEDGVVFKVVFNQIKKRKNLLLKSLNPAYKPYQVPIEEVIQVWRFVNYIADEIPKPEFTRKEMFELANNVEQKIKALKDELIALK